MLKKILFVLAAIVILFVIVVAQQPSQFRLARSATIAAPPAAVFAQVNDFHNWQAWSPWAKLDPAAKSSFAGPPAGVGAAFAWSGNREVGEGRMTILQSTPELIRIQIDFQRPMKCVNLAEFAFEPLGDQTRVTWTMTGENNFAAKAFHLFVNVDKTVGLDFEKGLAQLKSATEAEADKERAAPDAKAAKEKESRVR